MSCEIGKINYNKRIWIYLLTNSLRRNILWNVDVSTPRNRVLIIRKGRWTDAGGYVPG